MRTLYAIENDWIRLDELLEESGGEITPEIEIEIGKLLEDLESETEHKLENYCRMVREYQAQSEARKKESERLERSSIVVNNKAEFLKGRLLNFMRLKGEKKMPAGIFSLTRYTAGGMAPLIITEDVPEEYKVAKTTYSVDNAKVRAEIDAGKELAFARLGDRKEILKIG